MCRIKGDLRSEGPEAIRFLAKKFVFEVSNIKDQSTSCDCSTSFLVSYSLAHARRPSCAVSPSIRFSGVCTAGASVRYVSLLHKHNTYAHTNAVSGADRFPRARNHDVDCRWTMIFPFVIEMNLRANMISAHIERRSLLRCRRSSP